ncbi:MAG: BamA/TamA family outer membrane protein [Candidatus Coatesbacteria bacterium]|nr:BamA/TamA family outer membrane protein [Candidatus Coatesbacteria bacterium]
MVRLSFLLLLCFLSSALKPDQVIHNDPKIVYLKRFVYKIEYKGNTKTSRKVLDNHITIKEGDIFDEKKLAESLEKLIDLGYFLDVNVSISFANNDKSKIIITFLVEEKSTLKTNLGIGYNEQIGLTGMSNINDNNLFGKGQEGNLGIIYGKNGHQFNLFWRDPDFLNMPINLAVMPYYLNQKLWQMNYNKNNQEHTDKSYEQDRSFKIQRYGFKVPISIQTAFEPMNLFISPRFENIKTFDMNKDLSEELWFEQGSDKLITYKIGLRYLTTSIKHSRYPSYVELSVENSSKELKSSYEFQRYTLKVSQQISITNSMYSRVSPRIGLIFGSPPFYEKYWLGGLDSIRGYQSGWVNDTGEGGTKYWTTGFELGYVFIENKKILKRMSIIPFFDIGKVWSTKINDITKDVKFGYGIGTTVDLGFTQFYVAPALNRERIFKLEIGFGKLEENSLPRGSIVEDY